MKKNCFFCCAFLFFLTVACSMITGCVSLHGNMLPKVASDQIKPAAEKASVDYEVSWLVNGKPFPAVPPLFLNEIKSTFDKSGVFEKHSIGVGGAPFHLQIIMNNHGNMGAGAVLGFISGLTLTIIPAYAKDNYDLTVNLKQGEKTLKTYAYRDCMKTWIEFFLIFGTPGHTPNKVGKDIIDNMLLSFVRDLAADNLLKAGGS
jgi:hypothetical protein